ncbi:hypothetical protein C8A00DRAFT_15611 [Chaetomidium leptoderma]|uniref:Uncharacterized protein n=1 Tax=Chaetomidium leptoderma TaxID=669021 RepID=A0AAN6VMN8_9PEZI|nr:hypothetical protein C8A00DRAFT_15611 [Chaetomidium leptoderma]
MCRYYAHRHSCNHTQLSFAAFCAPAALLQNPCGSRHIWQTLAVEEACEDCRGGDGGGRYHDLPGLRR